MVKAIWEWPVPTLIQQVWSFHDLPLFHKRFVKNFSALIATVIEALKGQNFEWNDQAQRASEVIKEKFISAPILALLNFAKVVEVECIASRVGIRAALS